MVTITNLLNHANCSITLAQAAVDDTRHCLKDDSHILRFQCRDADEVDIKVRKEPNLVDSYRGILAVCLRQVKKVIAVSISDNLPASATSAVNESCVRLI